ncbi:9401_t:CDS:10 [Dentiscutata heterogama]|uniref:9401_t:CDS:1 n=1 Tax=Dentiscutata heterogama TaxID=1316150 RepID=A0ACA9JX90_9GLOM|nr:9401_t:CDS:10 [Dentiscutata heterogama]
MYVHRCRFVEYTPTAINALAFTPLSTQPLLACGRANGEIEIWNPTQRWNLEKIIPGAKNTSVEALTWVHRTILKESDSCYSQTKEEQEEFLKVLLNKPPRLFSASSNGLITEWDTTLLRTKPLRAVWCMSTNNANTLLAVGCDDGGLRIFDINDDGLILIKNLMRNDAKVMALAWDNDDKFIVSGSSDSNIIKWDVHNVRITQRMTVDMKHGKDNIVWTIMILKDGTIVSGDSLGHVCFWDGNLGTMLQKFKAHNADVLCLASNKEGTMVFSSGVDRKCNSFRIADYFTTQSSNDDFSENNWVLVGFRRTHLHDVRAMALREDLTDKFFVSGGVDASILVSYFDGFPEDKLQRLPFIPQKPLISISKSKKLLMYRSYNQIKIWRLGNAKLPDSWKFEQIPNLDLIEPQQAILEMTLKGNYNLMASALSEDGEWIAVSDIETIKVFKVQNDPSNPDRICVKKVKFPKISVNGNSAGAHHLIFTLDGKKLVIVNIDSSITIAELNDCQHKEIRILHQFYEHAQPLDGNTSIVTSIVTSIAVSGDSRWLAVGDLLNRINVYNLETFELHSTLPKFSSTHTALAFYPSKPTLVITLSSNEFFLYDIESQEIDDWSLTYSKSLPKTFLNLENRLVGCAFNPINSDTIILWGANYLCLIDFDKCRKDKGHQPHLATCTGWRENLKYKAIEQAPKQNGLTKKRKRDKPEKNIKRAKTDKKIINFQLVFRYRSLMYVDFIEPNTMIVVERPFAAILENLPPSFYKAQYGS